MKKLFLLIIALIMLFIPNTVILAQGSSATGNATIVYQSDPVYNIDINTPPKTPAVQDSNPVQQGGNNKTEEEVLKEEENGSDVDVLGDQETLFDRIVYLLQKDNVYSISLITLLIILLVLLIISYIINKEREVEEVFQL